VGQPHGVKDTGDACPPGAGRFLQFGELTHKIAERLTRLFAVESCDDRIVPDEARELPSLRKRYSPSIQR
jgi:hypothetical protein